MTPTTSPWAWVVTLAEKAGTTFLEVFLASWLAADALGASTAEAAALAGLAAAATVIANGLPVVPAGLPFVVDLVLATARTFAAAFLAYVGGAPILSLDYDLAVAAATAAIPAALAVAKGLLSSRLGSAASTRLLPDRLDATTPTAA